MVPYSSHSFQSRPTPPLQCLCFILAIYNSFRCYVLPGTFTHYLKIEMSLQEWQKVFTEKGLGDCTKNVKDADVARWIKGDLSLEDLPDMLDMVLEDAQTRKDFAAGNLMLAAKLSKATTKTQPEVKNEPIVGLGQHEAGHNARPAKRHFGDFRQLRG